jgi:hypothetical protein
MLHLNPATKRIWSPAKQGSTFQSGNADCTQSLSDVLPTWVNQDQSFFFFNVPASIKGRCCNGLVDSKLVLLRLPLLCCPCRRKMQIAPFLRQENKTQAMLCVAELPLTNRQHGWSGLH